MDYFNRILGEKARKVLSRGKSLLLLAPRQTGKTTFVRKQLKPHLEISFVQASARLRYEQDPLLLEKELESYIQDSKSKPIIFIDEIQKIPRVMDIVQYIIDKQQAQFILSGSSARKLKHGKDVNLLPGRVVSYTLSPLVYLELPLELQNLENFLLYGSLPGIIQDSDQEDKEVDLTSYVTTYLEDEIRSGAIVRNVGNFAHFLQLAAGESNKQVNMTGLSQDIGVATTTIAAYFQILVDCLIAHRIDPITKSTTKRRLIKSAKYIFFDMGIRRICANEGVKLSNNMFGALFEQYIGLQLLAFANIHSRLIKVKYWRDSAGPEIDFVLEYKQQLIPIEIKYSTSPKDKDCNHLKKFLNEYVEAEHGYIISRTTKRYDLNKNITVIPWQELHTIILNL